MPELPEVEFARRCLERWLGGETVTRVEADPTRVVRGSSPAALAALAGLRLERVERRGKWLVASFERGLGLVGHLGMTGKLGLQRPGDPPVPWSRARFYRKDKAIVHFRDPRMFGRLAAGPLETLLRDEGLAALGPDAWDAPYSPAGLQARLRGRRGAVKAALLDQAVLAGVGNIQATEALHHARIHPARRADSLTRAELERLLAGLRWSLARTLAMATGDELTYVEEPGADNPFLVYGRAGEPCPRCGGPLRSMVIGGRTSAFCPRCQRAPRGG
jgi:formamidopyrimidine-DNA glycosylase